MNENMRRQDVQHKVGSSLGKTTVGVERCGLGGPCLAPAAVIGYDW